MDVKRRGSSRRGFLGRALATVSAGAAGVLTARRGRAHPMPPHDVPPTSEGPKYDFSNRPSEPDKHGTRMGGMPGAVFEPTPPADAPKDESAYRRFDIRVELLTHEFVPGVKAHVLAFNGDLPGPEIRVREGEWVRVDFKNDTNLLHTIHWHGLLVPENMDGVPYVTQPPAMPGQTFVYRFRALPYGTHFYHCHFGTVLHMQSGMHGAFIIDKDDDPIRRTFPYTREYTLILGQFDTSMVEGELGFMEKRMRERQVLMREGRITDRILARFPSVKAFLAAIDDGWIPPYLQSRNAPPHLPRFNLYTINGKAYPMTPKLKIERDEIIRVRLINAGQVEHYMHLHGHDFWEVARDGAPLPHAIRGNTIPVTPGRTHDIVIEGTNPGVWTFHDHDTRRVTNNGLYPGGMLTTLHYEDFEPEYPPHVALDE
ncbi:MAG: multicopper oxidase family protein [Myxococcota bacterium]